MKNIEEKYVIITGANSGLGLALTKYLSFRGAHVIMACRNIAKANRSLSLIKEENPFAKIAIMELDLADLDSVKNFIENYKNNYERLDILVNNAGLESNIYQESRQGFEICFATNHLGHFLLTGGLLNLLSKSDEAKIVVYSSTAHFIGDANFLIGADDVYNSLKVYGNSKLANLMFTYTLNQKLKENNVPVKVEAVHPGWVKTNFGRENENNKLYNIISNKFCINENEGIEATKYALFNERLKGGEYISLDGLFTISGRAKVTKSSHLSYNKEKQKELWNLSQELTGFPFSI